MSGLDASVSVVIPTTGRPELTRAIESVEGQTHSAAEIIIVVDNPDAISDIAALLADRARVTSTRGFQGGAVARNVGTSAASGTFVAYLDDDDWWEPEKLERQVEALSRNGASFSWTSTSFRGRSGERVLPRLPPTSWTEIGSYLVQRSRPRHGDGYIQTSSIVVERTLALKIQWDENLRKHQDWDFVIRVVRAIESTGEHIAQPLAVVQQDSSGSVSKVVDLSSTTAFFEKHRGEFGSRARSDFIWVHIVRPLLRAGQWGDAVAAVRQHPRPPHIASALVGISGGFRWLLSRIRGEGR